MRRKTRFVCVSDTHGYTPSEAGFKLPAGDVLIHAGDLTNNGSMSELRRTMDWISKADFEIKILVAGQFIFLFFDDTQWLFSMKPVN
jgi:3',5'-cyclic AMP phosphodiesterase CpdA